MQGKLTFNNTRGALRAIRVIIETDQGTYEAGMPIQGDLGNVTQVGFALLKPGPVPDVADVRKRVEEGLARGGGRLRKESFYGKG